MLAASSAVAQDDLRELVPGSNDLTLETRDYGSDAVDLDVATRDLELATRDLVAPVLDMIRVTTAPKQVKIELPADVLFDFDRSDIRPDAAIALLAAADLLRKGVRGPVKIDGHTDSKGAADYNLKLSKDRAKSVQIWLSENGNLPQGMRFTLTGYGANKPAVPNTKPDGSDDPEGQQVNRRVEITFTPK